MSLTRVLRLFALVTIQLGFLSTFLPQLETVLALMAFGIIIVISLPFRRLSSGARFPFGVVVGAVGAVAASIGLVRGYALRDVLRDVSFFAGVLIPYVAGLVMIRDREDIDRLSRDVVTASAITLPVYLGLALTGLLRAETAYEYRVEYVARYSVTYIFPWAILVWRNAVAQWTWRPWCDRLLLLLFSGAVSLSGSRVDYGTVVLVSAGFVFLRASGSRGWKRAVLMMTVVIGVMVSGLAIFGSGVLAERLSQIDINDRSVQWRVTELEEGYRVMVAATPMEWLVGIGLGYRMPLARPQVLAGNVYHDIPIMHSSYQFYLMKAGLVGTVLMVMPMMWAAIRGLRARDWLDTEAGVVLAIALVQGVAAMGLTDPRVLSICGGYLAGLRRRRVHALPAPATVGARAAASQATFEILRRPYGRGAT